MTSRERWTVYPLLFLALGMGLRNRQMDVMHYKAIVCETLELVDKEGKPLAVLGSRGNKEGVLEFVNEKQQVTTALNAHGLRVTDLNKRATAALGGSGLQLADLTNQVMAQLSSEGSRGSMQLASPSQKAFIRVGLQEPLPVFIVGREGSDILLFPRMETARIQPAATPAPKAEESPTEEPTTEPPKPDPAPENPNPEAATPEPPTDSAPDSSSPS